MAVQTIKSLTRGPWGEKKHTHATWYEPLVDQADIDTAVHYILNHSRLFLNTVSDIHLLPKVLAAATRFQPQPQNELDEKLARLQMSPLFV